MNTIDELKADVLKEFPTFELISKDQSLFMKTIGLGLKILTLGGMSSFMVNYMTTIRYTMYTPSNWNVWPESEKVILMRHERVHMRQSRKLSFFLYMILYLFIPLPGFFAYFRAKFEMEAYAESILAEVDILGPAHVDEPRVRKFYIDQFVGPAYFYMWPFRKSVENWLESAIAKAKERL